MVGSKLVSEDSLWLEGVRQVTDRGEWDTGYWFPVENSGQFETGATAWGVGGKGCLGVGVAKSATPGSCAEWWVTLWGEGHLK